MENFGKFETFFDNFGYMSSFFKKNKKKVTKE